MCEQKLLDDDLYLIDSIDMDKTEKDSTYLSKYIDGLKTNEITKMSILLTVLISICDKDKYKYDVSKALLRSIWEIDNEEGV